ncbi:MAG: RnfABCDGE type electron transport complex subunit B [Peptococcaceae bacterium]|jgi:electron transport complex protein RnfB|nr:RnfABCDGE type electron transport complex subunit B [Peptococcaceae bacterium]
MVTQILWPLATLGGMGILFGLLLSYASKKFYVEVDERVALVRECLPGANCGGCGYAGCDNLAAAVVEGSAKVSACPVGGAAVAEQISAIMGLTGGTDFEKVAAYVLCNGAEGGAREIYHYDGVSQCAAAAQFDGGPKSCRFACLGYGDCVRACKFGAVTVVHQQAKVDPDKCTGCGACAAACPKGVIQVTPVKMRLTVACRNTDAAKKVREVCARGCIACKRCEKACEYGAIHVAGGVAQIDYAKCTNCGKCAEQCPSKCIVEKI